MKKELTKIFSECLDIAEEKISDDTSADTTADWDSLTMVKLVSAIEGELGVELSFDDLQQFTSFDAVYKLLKEREEA